MLIGGRYHRPRRTAIRLGSAFAEDKARRPPPANDRRRMVNAVRLPCFLVGMPWYEILGLAIAAWIVVPLLLVVFSLAAARLFDYRSAKQ